LLAWDKRYPNGSVSLVSLSLGAGIHPRGQGGQQMSSFPTDAGAGRDAASPAAARGGDALIDRRPIRNEHEQ
jgi:hypothetical protein